MTVTLDFLRSQQQDYLLAQWEGEGMVLEPFCACGNALDGNYHCSACNRECQCTLIVCSSPQALSMVEKLISGNPDFRGFKASLLQK